MGITNATRLARPQRAPISRAKPSKAASRATSAQMATLARSTSFCSSAGLYVGRIVARSFENSPHLPLQTGASTVGKPVVFLVIYLLVCGVVSRLIFSDDMGATFIVMLSFVGAFGVVAMVSPFRATDLLLDSTHFRVVGGPYNDTRCAWSEVDTEGCALKREDNPAIASNVGNVYCYRLTVAKRDGSSLVVARATENAADEIQSLSEVLSVILSLASPPSPDDTVAPAPDVLACPSCGALASPVGTLTTHCAFCSAEIVVSETLRKRVADALELSDEQATTRKLAARVINQPKAHGVNLELALLSAIYFGAMVVANLAAFHWKRADLALIAIAVFVGSFASVRTRIADRVALHTLASSCGARPPTRAGAPNLCRCCCAPLPDAKDDEVVVRCVYCSAENVLGIDLRSGLTTARSIELELDWVLSARTVVHSRRAVALVFALALIAAGVGLSFA